MLKIQYCSDLHLEFQENSNYIFHNPIEAVGDILLLAGDIGLFAQLKQYDWFFDDLSIKFKAVYWIAGNHEYYHSDIKERTGSFCEKIRKNVFLVNNQVVEVEGFQLIFSTLWTKIAITNADVIEKSLSDFYVIRNGENKFSVADYNSLFEENYAFVKQALQNKKRDLKTIVVSHHVPTNEHYPEKYKTSTINDAFAVELSDLIIAFEPDFWIYGHHHCNVGDFSIGKTKMLTNQLGYVKYGENAGFSHSKLV